MGMAGLDRSGESANVGVTAGGNTNGAVTGRDASIKYTNTSFGQIAMSTARGGDYFNAVATVDAPIIEMDGKLHETRSSSDHVAYTVPIGPVYFNVDHGEPSGGKGLGAGTMGSANAGRDQENNTYSLYYSGGPLTLLGAYRTYNNRYKAVCSFTSCEPFYATKDDLVNLQFAYDFGKAKLGLGYQQANGSSGVTVTDTMIALSIPVGSWTFGAAWSNSVLANAPDTTMLGGPGVALKGDARNYNGSASGMSVGASYALSKRTSVITRYARWNHSGYSQFEADAAGTSVVGSGGLNYTREANETSILLSHTF